MLLRNKRPPNSQLGAVSPRRVAAHKVRTQSIYRESRIACIQLFSLSLEQNRLKTRPLELIRSRRENSFQEAFRPQAPKRCALKTTTCEFHSENLDRLCKALTELQGAVLVLSLDSQAQKQRETRGRAPGEGAAPVRGSGQRLSGCRGRAGPSCSLRTQARSPSLEGKNSITKGKRTLRVLNPIWDQRLPNHHR